ncbi:MAG: hypothetical protein HY329_15100 [Chloroflexi bacterium]|nr:hypothetical protein [Chloroflexota bacterium]
MKNVKWLTKIEIVDKDFIGYWQESGWSDTAEYQIFSRVDTPTPGEKRHPENATIAGVGFAGNRGITKVEVSLDGGKTWREAAVKERMSDHAWQLWAFEWKPEKDDSYLVAVRATEGTGAVQVQTMTDPAPNGATGYHTLVLTVDGSQPKPAA